MKKRILTAIVILIVYVGVLLLTLLVHPVFFDIFAVLLMVIAGLEVSRAVSKRYGQALDIVIVVEIMLGYLCFILINKFVGNGMGVAAYFGVLVLAFLVCIVWNMFSKVMTLRNVSSTVLVLVYPVSLLIYMLGLNYLPDRYRVAALILAFVVCPMTDTFAFFVGSMLKGPKLAPKVSPNKTVSGALGGLLGGIAGGAIVLLLSIYDTGLGVQMIGDSTLTNVLHYLVIGFGASAFTQLGDLIASYLKRLCDIKDYGTLLPGHGGIMDRIDGLIVASVFIYIYMLVLSVL